MDDALRSRILEVLGRQDIMMITTIRPDGYPQATTVNYIHDDLVLYFATAATSQKAGNIKLNNKVSVAIVDRAQDFYKLRGLSMPGTAASVQEKQRAEEFALRLFRRLPQSKRFAQVALNMDEPRSDWREDVRIGCRWQGRSGPRERAE
jgi:pyridoxine/pyridoxamine 5'-phosphate oxidase